LKNIFLTVFDLAGLCSLFLLQTQSFENVKNVVFLEIAMEAWSSGSHIRIVSY
jgi:hypothetical protein